VLVSPAYPAERGSFQALSDEITPQEKKHDVFDKYRLGNTFEIYHGTYTSAVAKRFQNHVLSFFSENLCFTNECK